VIGLVLASVAFRYKRKEHKALMFAVTKSEGEIAAKVIAARDGAGTGASTAAVTGPLTAPVHVHVHAPTHTTVFEGASASMPMAFPTAQAQAAQADHTLGSKFDQKIAALDTNFAGYRQSRVSV
jgi:hypothetical protein